jgi:hypothetical protein
MDWDGYAEPEQAEARWEGSDWHGTIPAAAKPMGPKQPGHPPPTAAAMPMQPSRAVYKKIYPDCPIYKKNSAKQAQPAAAPAMKPSQPKFPPPAKAYGSPPAKAYGYMDEESKIWVNRRRSPACREPKSSLHGVAPKTPEFMKEEPKTPPAGEKSDDEVDALEAAVRQQARVRLKTS